MPRLMGGPGPLPWDGPNAPGGLRAGRVDRDLMTPGRQALSAGAIR